ncbi:ribosome small subunit-dependent GTPase A [Coprothermobacteraceae bacterium]|nr:ribosome small subunit-dependent GTPase A [Coprothermobacteraceae bacterium]
MKVLFLGRIMRIERYQVVVAHERMLYKGLVRKKLWDTDKLMVNDRVWFSRINADEVAVERLLPRRNFLRRPPVANLDLVVYVHSIKHPESEVKYLDLTLGLAGLWGIDALVLLHKADLAEENTLHELAGLYQSLGYKVMVTSIHWDLSEVKTHLSGKCSLFTGPSGAGKSSIIKKLWEDAPVRVGDITRRGKGRHTTSWVELLEMDDAFVVDAPGFSLLDPPPMSPREVQLLFPEIWSLSNQCFFDDCLHVKEPRCAVKEAVREGKIAHSRYASYKYWLEKTQEERA